MTDQQDENKLIAERRAKLHALREEGTALFPNDFRPQHSAAELQSGFGDETKEDLETLGKIVSVAGRVIRNRGAYCCSGQFWQHTAVCHQRGATVRQVAGSR